MRMNTMSSRRVFLKRLGAGAAGLGFLSLGAGCQTLLRAAGTAGLARSLPELQGVDPKGILAFLDAAAERKVELHSFMMLRHGHVVAEGWWRPYAPDLVHTLYSLSKSFTSTAVGFAVSEGRLSVDDRVVKFFPQDLPGQVGDNLAALRVRDLLSMAVGNEKEPTGRMVEQDDWVKSFLAAPITHEPGSVFMYNSAATYMCSAIVQKLTGQRVVDYLRPRLFDPLGIDKFSWETCPRGINTGGWGLSLQTESLAKVGQLLLQKGAWNGRQVIPAAWVEEATTKKIQQPFPAKPGRPNEENDWVQGYGYQFWRCTHNAFRGDGAFGQFMIVMPAQDAVVIMTAESNAYQGQIDLVWQHLLPAMDSSADAMPCNDLAPRLQTLHLAGAEGATTSPMAGKVGGRTYQLEKNDLGLESVSFSFIADVNMSGITFLDGAGNFHGLGDLYHETALPGTPPRLVGGHNSTKGRKFKIDTSGAWKDDNTFVLLVRYIETPHHDTITCRFDGDRVEISFMNSIAAMSANPKDKRPVLQGAWGV